MGQVGETIQSDVRVDGYPIEGTVYYIYCDHCGSFKIKSHIPISLSFGIIISVIMVGKLWSYLIEMQNYYGPDQFGCWLIFFIGLVFSSLALNQYLPHKCIKCGNTNISNKDTKGYSNIQNIYQVIDIPKNRLHEHKNKSYDLIGDLKSLPLFLLIILFIIFIEVIVPFLILSELFSSKNNKKK